MKDELHNQTTNFSRYDCISNLQYVQKSKLRRKFRVISPWGPSMLKQYRGPLSSTQIINIRDGSRESLFRINDALSKSVSKRRNNNNIPLEGEGAQIDVNQDAFSGLICPKEPFKKLEIFVNSI